MAIKNEPCSACGRASHRRWRVTADYLPSIKLLPWFCDPCGDAFMLGVAHVLVELKTAADGAPVVPSPEIFQSRVDELRKSAESRKG